MEVILLRGEYNSMLFLTRYESDLSLLSSFDYRL